jgi:acetyltransferase
MTEHEAKEFLHNYEIPVVRHKIVRSESEAANAATEVGFPAALKIMSPDILHKTEVGGVRLDINTPIEAKSAYRGILKDVKKHAPKALVQGVLVEAMVRKRYEILIGSKKDPIFGPVIVFGMGGVAVEIFKDTKVGLPPLNMALCASED